MLLALLRADAGRADVTEVPVNTPGVMDPCPLDAAASLSGRMGAGVCEIGRRRQGFAVPPGQARSSRTDSVGRDAGTDEDPGGQVNG